MTEENDSPVCEDEERERANQCLQELIGVLQKYNLRVQDLTVVYGNLGYAIGASVEGHKDGEGPTLEELQQQYYTSPTLGCALMLQGMLVTSWYDQVSNGLTLENTESDKEKKNG